MQNLPLYISIVFALAALASVILFYLATNKSKIVLAFLLGWMILQGAISYTGFYTVTNTFPPRFLLLTLPPVAAIIILHLTKQGKKFISNLNTSYLTLLHIVRVPVEMVLFWLFLNKLVPQLITFEGRNFDIFAGLTAPFIFYFGLIKNRISNAMLLVWNVGCLALLINIVTYAALSAPFPFQQFGFEQPNIAVLYFPFVWLPSLVVPLVLLSHLATISKLINLIYGSKNTSSF